MYFIVEKVVIGKPTRRCGPVVTTGYSQHSLPSSFGKHGLNQLLFAIDLYFDCFVLTFNLLNSSLKMFLTN